MGFLAKVGHLVQVFFFFFFDRAWVQFLIFQNRKYCPELKGKP